MTASQSEYLRYLPEVLRSSDGGTGFLDGYLKIFEALLSGRADAAGAIHPPIAALPVRAFDSAIESLKDLLDPALTPVDAGTAPGNATSEFLDYLGRWVALSFDQNWGLDKRREWLRRVVPLYKKRGTRAGIDEYLAMFVGHQARVEEPRGFILADRPTSVLGVNTFISAPAHYFRVRIEYGFPPNPFDIAEWRNIRQGTRAIVDLEKPAHTYYTLRGSTPGIILGGLLHGGPNGPLPARGKGRATIGVDTLIWKDSKRIGATS
jgi:phage tail-like protein